MYDLYSSSYYDFNLVNCNNEKNIRNTLETYGVGSCGPRAFLGTTLPHIKIEQDIAQFIGKDVVAIQYPSTLSIHLSILNAFASKRTLVMYDEKCCYAAKEGINLSRTNSLSFQHNNINSFKEKINIIKSKKYTDIFLIIEGVYYNTGEKIEHFDEIVNLCSQYKIKIILNDTYAFGFIGGTGKGTCEKYGVHTNNIFQTIIGLDAVLGGMGAIAYGTKENINIQRLNGSGYTYSASVPPIYVANASASLQSLKTNFEEYVNELIINISTLNGLLNTNYTSPIIYIKANKEDLVKIKNEIKDAGADVAIPRHNSQEALLYHPCIRIILKHNSKPIIEPICDIIKNYLI